MRQVLLPRGVKIETVVCRGGGGGGILVCMRYDNYEEEFLVRS